MKKITIISLIFLFSCSSQTIFKKLSDLEKVTNKKGILYTATGTGVAKEDEENLYISASLNLWIKDSNGINKKNPEGVDYVIDLVKIGDDIYLLAQKDSKLRLFQKVNAPKEWKNIWDNEYKPIKFLKAIDEEKVKVAYILVQDGNKQIILELTGSDKIKGDEKTQFYNLSNDGEYITANNGIYDIDGTKISYPDKNKFMPIINEDNKYIIATGGYESEIEFNAYYSQDLKQWKKTEVNTKPGKFISYFMRKIKTTEKDILVIGGNLGYLEAILDFKKPKPKIDLQLPNQTVNNGTYLGSGIGSVGLVDIIPVGNNTYYILTKGKGIWEIENCKLNRLE